MKRFAAALFVAFLALPALAQTTTITATNERMAGAPISTGTASFTAISAARTAIPFADAAGNGNGPEAFQCQIAAGAVTGFLNPDGTLGGTCAVPDSTLTAPPVQYMIQVCDTSLDLSTSGQCFQEGPATISGATWALDRFAPANTVPLPTALTLTTAVSPPPASCTAPAEYRYVSNGAVTAYTCYGGVFIAYGGGGGGTSTPATSTSIGGVQLASGVGSNILAKVASTGSYTDLLNLPTIPAAPTGATPMIQGLVYLPPGQSSNTLAKVAITGNYSDLNGAPTGGGSAPAATSSAAGIVQLAPGQGSNVLSKVASTGNAADLASTTFPLGPRFAVKTYIATGDSITHGEGVANMSTDAYVYKIASGMGLPSSAVTDLGVDGYQSADWTRLEIFAHLNPTPANNPLVTALILHNDLHFCSTSTDNGSSSNSSGNTAGCLANAYSNVLSGITWAAIPINYKTLGAQCSQAGTWAADTSIIASGISSSTSGSAASCAVTTTTASQAVYLWNGGTDGDGGTATVSIDGTQVGTLATASTSGQIIHTIDGNNNTVWGQRYVIAAAGTHTVSVAVTSGSGTIHLVGIGTPPLGAAPQIAPPSIFIGDPIFENGYNDQAATTAYTSQLSTEVALLRNDGLLVQEIKTQNYMNAPVDMSGSNVTVPNGMGDEGTGTTCSAVTPAGDVGQHPNICGHQDLANGFLGTIQPSALAGAAATFSFPSAVASIDALASVTPAADTNSAIGGGLNYYSSGTSSPGYSAGTSFMYDSNSADLGGAGFKIVDYLPTQFVGRYFCVYPTNTTVTAFSQLTCGAYMDKTGVFHFTSNPTGITSSGGGTTFPNGPSALSGLADLDPSGTTSPAIISGFNLYSASQQASNPTAGYETGRAIFYSGNGFQDADYQPTNFTGRYMCTYPNGTNITAFSQLTCPIHFVPSTGTTISTFFQETLYTPSSSSATCTAGQFADDASYHYVCTAANTWKSVGLSAFQSAASGASSCPITGTPLLTIESAAGGSASVIFASGTASTNCSFTVLLQSGSIPGTGELFEAEFAVNGTATNFPYAPTCTIGVAGNGAGAGMAFYAPSSTDHMAYATNTPLAVGTQYTLTVNCRVN